MVRANPRHRKAPHPNRSTRPRAAAAYILLETVIATALLIVALAVIGTQVQSSQKAVHGMHRKAQAMMLAERQLAELDLGLLELDSLDEVNEGDFGPRFPDWGWRLVTQETSIDGMYQLQVEILYLFRDGDYQEDSFEYDDAETVFTVYAFRPVPAKVDFATDFGLNEEELDELSNTMAQTGNSDCDPKDIDNFNVAKCVNAARIPEDLEALLALLDKSGYELEEIASFIPPDVMQKIKEAGLFGTEEEKGTGEEGGDQAEGGGQ